MHNSDLLLTSSQITGHRHHDHATRMTQIGGCSRPLQGMASQHMCQVRQGQALQFHQAKLTHHRLRTQDNNKLKTRPVLFKGPAHHKLMALLTCGPKSGLTKSNSTTLVPILFHIELNYNFEKKAETDHLTI